MRYVTLGCLLIAVAIGTSRADDAYQLPPQSVVDVIDAKPEPGVSISPDGEWMLLIKSDAMPDIEDVGFMESYMGWDLIYRTPLELNSLASEIDKNEVGARRIWTDRRRHLYPCACGPCSWN